MSIWPMPDLSDARVAAELEDLRRGAAAMDTLLSDLRKRAAEHAAALVEFERNFTRDPTPAPVVMVVVAVDVIPGFDFGDVDPPDGPLRH